MPNLVFLTRTIPLDIKQNPDEGISDFRISGQSFINENCRNSRTSHDKDMKLGPVTKLGQRKTTTSKNLDDDVMSENYDVIMFFSIYGQFTVGCRTHDL